MSMSAVVIHCDTVELKTCSCAQSRQLLEEMVYANAGAEELDCPDWTVLSPNVHNPTEQLWDKVELEPP